MPSTSRATFSHIGEHTSLCSVVMSFLLVVSIIDGVSAFTFPSVKPRSKHLHTPTSTCITIAVAGECQLSLHEVQPTTGHHMTAFEPVEYPQPEQLHQHMLNSTHFGTAALTLQYVTHRFHVSYVDPITGVTMYHIEPDPRIIYLDTHGDEDAHKNHETDSHASNHQHHHHHEADQLGHMSEVGYLMVWVPSNIPMLSVACRNRTTTVDVSLPLNSATGELHPLRKHFLEQDDTSTGIQFTAKRTVGPPDRVNNVVFLSDGFLAGENATFFSRVDYILALIDENPSADPNINTQKYTVPLDRYIAFWNVYAVFQPSPEQGASRPLYGIAVNDNLKCYHTPQLERAIQCDRSLAKALAEVSPANVANDPDRTLIIVIVNTPLYGGTGLFQAGVIHIGHFFNGSGMIDTNTQGYPYTYASLINHECGHAYGQLLDEYDMGRSSSQPYVDWPNCIQPNAAGTSYNTPIKWQFWIDVFNGGNATLSEYYLGKGKTVLPVGYGTDPTPMTVCGYSNYFKGSQACMMNRLDNYFMCPQCREGYSKAIFQTSPFEMMWPRYPLDDQILVASRTNSAMQGIAGGGITLHLPKILVAAEYYAVVWVDQFDDPLTPSNDTGCPTCQYISPETILTWPNDTIITYKAYISDLSVYIPASQRSNYSNMNQVATFRMMLPSVEPNTVTSFLGNASNSSTPNITVYPKPTQGATAAAYGAYGAPPGRLVDGKDIYIICSAAIAGTNATCTMDFTAQTYNSPGNIDLLAQYDAYVLYILGGVGALFILLWLYASARYKKVAGRVVRPIFKTEFSTIVTLIRRIMMVSSILFMGGAVGALVASGYFFTKTSFIGKIIIIAGVLVALVLYVMAFLGFWAIANRAKRLVMANGLLMIAAEATLIALLALCNIVGESITNTKDYNNILTDWWLDLVKNDPTSACGWQQELTCSGWGDFACNGNFYVREYCPDNCQQYNEQFGISCQSQIQELVKTWYPIVAACLAVAVGLMGFAIAFNYIYYFSLWHMKKQFRERNNERVYKASARQGIARQDVDRAKGLHVLRTLDVGDLQHLVKEFKRIDEDGNGTLSKKELGIFFRKALCYKIQMDELNNIFEAMDIDGDGSISIDEFLAVFGREQQNMGMLQFPGGSGQPLVPGSQFDRQRKVRERLESTFQQSGVFEAPQQTPVQYHPVQAMNTERQQTMGFHPASPHAQQPYNAPPPPPTQQQHMQYQPQPQHYASAPPPPQPVVPVVVAQQQYYGAPPPTQFHGGGGQALHRSDSL